VPDKGEYEINILTAADLTNAGHRVSLFEVDANYGMLLKIMGHELPTQVKIDAPLDARSESGQPFMVGIGAALFGLSSTFTTTNGPVCVRRSIRNSRLLLQRASRRAWQIPARP
jgi:hypothetical protein